jgi:uncharacterized protein YcbX
MSIGTVHGLWRYPVKSMGGEPLPAVRVSYGGIPGDRGWAVYDDARQGVTSAKRVPALRQLRARYSSVPVAGEAPPPAEIQFPDGSIMMSDSPDCDSRLSAFAGRALSMRSLGALGGDAPPRVSGVDDSPETMRQLMGILPGESEPDYSMFTPERLKQLRQGNFFDAFTLSVISRQTLRALGRIAPDCDWDTRRFRMNLIVDTTASGPYPEHEWAGKQLHIGEAVLDVVMPCPRCVMVTLAEAELPQDHQLMRVLVRETRHHAGIYLSVSREGVVREGDAIELLG